MDTRQKIAALIEENKKLLDTAKAEERNLTDEEQAEFDNRLNEIDKLRKMVEAEEKHAELEDWANRSVKEPPKTDPETTNVQVGKNRAEDAPFRSLGEQLQAIVRFYSPGEQKDPRLFKLRAASGANEGVPSEGGFLVQQDFVSDIVNDTWQTARLPGRCTRIPISTNANGTKILGIDETSRANGSRWGGVQAYWVGEADTATATKPKFREINLSLNKLMGIAYATDEMLQDAAQIEAVFKNAFTSEIGFKLDDAIIRGDGAGKPLGILNSGGTVSQAKEASQSADTIVAANIKNMWSRLLPWAKPNSVWLINSEILPQLFDLASDSGGVTPLFMPPGGLSQSPYGTLLGRPIIEMEQCEELGTVGDIILGDFSKYLLADKGTMDAASSIHVRFIYDETAFRFVYRVDGQPLRSSPVTPYQGNSGYTLGDFVVLATRA